MGYPFWVYLLSCPPKVKSPSATIASLSGIHTSAVERQIGEYCKVLYRSVLCCFFKGIFPLSAIWDQGWFDLFVQGIKDPLYFLSVWLHGHCPDFSGLVKENFAFVESLPEGPTKIRSRSEDKATVKVRGYPPGSWFFSFAKSFPSSTKLLFSKSMRRNS